MEQPNLNRKTTGLHTPYMIMSVKANHVRMRYNFLASLFTWFTLAGFITLPNTFSSLASSSNLNTNRGGQIVQEVVRNVQLLPLAGVLCGVGIIGTCYLWWECRKNYIWLLRQLFLPGLYHSLIGLFSTVVGILTSQGGYVSATAMTTVIAVSSCVVIMAILSIIYYRLIDRTLTSHDRAIAQETER